MVESVSSLAADVDLLSITGCREYRDAAGIEVYVTNELILDNDNLAVGTSLGSTVIILNSVSYLALNEVMSCDVDSDISVYISLVSMALDLSRKMYLADSNVGCKYVSLICNNRCADKVLIVATGLFEKVYVCSRNINSNR